MLNYQFSWWERTRSRFLPATKNDLDRMEKKLMATVREYTDQINARLDEQSADAAELATAVEGVAVDVAELKKTIDKLQSTPGVLSTEDQALLDAAQQRVAAVAAGIKETTAKAKALDEATSVPPPTPPTPPEEPAPNP